MADPVGQNISAVEAERLDHSRPVEFVHRLGSRLRNMRDDLPAFTSELSPTADTVTGSNGSPVAFDTKLAGLGDEAKDGSILEFQAIFKTTAVDGSSPGTDTLALSLGGTSILSLDRTPAANDVVSIRAQLVATKEVRASGSILVANSTSSNYNAKGVSLTDALGNTVEFEADNTAAVDSTPTRVSASKYTFGAQSDPSTSALATAIVAAMDLARSNAELQISASIDAENSSKIVLEQILGGNISNTTMTQDTDPAHLVLTQFGGGSGEFVGFFEAHVFTAGGFSAGKSGGASVIVNRSGGSELRLSLNPGANANSTTLLALHAQTLSP